MLVNIYGSKDLFVSEYRTLLADRILSSFNYDTEKEVTISILYCPVNVMKEHAAQFTIDIAYSILCLKIQKYLTDNL